MGSMDGSHRPRQSKDRRWGGGGPLYARRHWLRCAQWAQMTRLVFGFSREFGCQWTSIQYAFNFAFWGTVGEAAVDELALVVGIGAAR